MPGVAGCQDLRGDQAVRAGVSPASHNVDSLAAVHVVSARVVPPRGALSVVGQSGHGALQIVLLLPALCRVSVRAASVVTSDDDAS